MVANFDYIYEIINQKQSKLLILKLGSYLILLLLLLPKGVVSQGVFKLDHGRNKESIKFKFVSNLIILPVEVNGVELSFILDTGVNKPILFNLGTADSVQVKNVEEIYIKGLGDGDPVKALKSMGNEFRMKSVYNHNQELYVVLDTNINFSPRLGFPIHGIIGYDLFRDFIVEINYVSNRLKLYDPLTYVYEKCRKCETLPLKVIQNKPFIEAEVIAPEYDIMARLLIDSGSSDALWLFQNDIKGITVPKKNFEDFLGRGLSGSIYGNRSRVNSLKIGSFVMENAKVAFPDSISLQHLSNLKNRDGSLGAEVLKRFHLIFDYQQEKLTLRKNGNFKEPFKYNMSGIELQHNGLRVVKQLASNVRGVVPNDASSNGEVKIVLADLFKYELHPAFEIVEVRKGSPAEDVGLKKGDVILTVNGKPTHRSTLQEVAEMLNDKDGKVIRLLIDRDGVELRFVFTLKEIL